MTVKLKERNIPSEMKRFDQWVLWRLEKTEKGKDTKPLYNSRTSRKASHSNPETWGPYEQAIAACENGNGFDGIGFVFCEEDPFTGFDFDHVLDPVTGKMAPWAEKLIHEFKSYTEISPSGTGVKIIVKGKLPSGGIKTKHVEAYDKTRYFTITGNVYGGYDRIIENQDAISSLVEKIQKSREEKQKSKPEAPAFEPRPGDSEIIELMLDSQSRFKISPLLDGDFSAYPSQSEADQALASHLAFWTGKDPGQMDRIFRGSGLYREKWDKVHFNDGRTYGQSTIDRAIAATTETYKAPRNGNGNESKGNTNQGKNDHQQSEKEPKREQKRKGPSGMTLDDLQKTYSREPVWVWKKHVPKGMPIIVNGREGSGKTSIKLQACKEVLSNHKEGNICWLATEGAVADTVNKMVELEFNDPRFLIGQKSDGSFKWDMYLQGDRKQFETLLDELSPVIAVVVDSIRGMSRLDDNDAGVGHIMQAINAIVCDKHGAALVYLDHHGKGKKDTILDRAVGTTAKTAAVRAVLSVLPVSKFKRRIVVAKSNISTIGGELESFKKGNRIFITEPKTDSDETMLDRAEQFLIGLFTENKSLYARDVYSQGEDEGISEHMLKKAKSLLGIKSHSKGPKAPWMWESPF